MLRVMQLISSLEVGGAERLLINLVKSAQTDDVKLVTVVMNDQVDPNLRQELECLGHPVYFLDRPQGHQHPRYLWQLLRLIRNHRIDVVHAHNGGSKLWGFLCKLAMPRLQLIFTVHATNIIPRLSKWQLRAHRRLIDCHVAISKAVESECRNAGIDRVEQIYNGIPVGRFARPAPKQTRKGGPFRLVNVARLQHTIKGQDVLLQALKRCHDHGLDFHCQFVGGVYEYNRKSFSHLQQLVQGLGLANNVEFIINQSDIPPYLHQADLFVLPSRYEGLGLVILEAMAAEVPVVASRIDGPQELIRDGVTGFLFEMGNPEALAERILFAAQHPATTAEVARQAREQVHQFDIAEMKGRYLALYQSCLSKASLYTLGRIDSSALRG
jgi:glycosyltransferase involved in cell wall biosynthesis